MERPLPSPRYPDEWRLNLLKDGGCRVFYGGDPYEDDVERVPPPEEPLPRAGREEVIPRR